MLYSTVYITRYKITAAESSVFWEIDFLDFCRDSWITPRFTVCICFWKAQPYQKCAETELLVVFWMEFDENRLKHKMTVFARWGSGPKKLQVWAAMTPTVFVNGQAGWWCSSIRLILNTTEAWFHSLLYLYAVPYISPDIKLLLPKGGKGLE